MRFLKFILPWTLVLSTGGQAQSKIELNTQVKGVLPPANGGISPADKAKLDSVATGATANSTDAQLRDRTTHTGVQPIAATTGLQAALDAKADDSQFSAYGLSLVDDIDAGTARATLGLGSAAASASTAFEPAGTVTAHAAAADPHAVYPPRLKVTSPMRPVPMLAAAARRMPMWWLLAAPVSCRVPTRLNSTR